MKKILINEQPWQTRVAIIENDLLQNIYFWSHAGNQIERCFFKGTITKVLPGIQTAFVDIGQEKSGFLHVSEIDRDLAINKMSEGLDHIETTSKKDKPLEYRPIDISKVLKEDEDILIQISKEPVNEKGAKLTTCYTLPGRFLVLMPNIGRVGTSKKIEDRDERNRLKELVIKNLPEGMGAIIRTCSENRTEQEIKQDLSYLLKSWDDIQAAYEKAIAPAKIYQDINLAFQVIRDHLDEDIESVIIDNKDSQKELAHYVKEIAPEYSTKIQLYTGSQPLFEKYDIEEQIKDSLHSKVDLKSGGSIVIEATEAMTVVDVNTGRFIGKTNLEDTILKTNLEAAQEVVRQLKVRNIGGLIVIDFIDMATHANRQKLFKFFEKTLKDQDKFQSVVLKISEFGLVQMTRKRSGKTLAKQLTDDCSTCKGTGFIPSVRAESYKVLQNIKQELESKGKGTITLKLNPQVFEHISTIEYQTLFDFEKKHDCKIILQSQKGLEITQFLLETE